MALMVDAAERQQHDTQNTTPLIVLMESTTDAYGAMCQHKEGTSSCVLCVVPAGVGHG